MAFPQTAAPTESTIENVTNHPVLMPPVVNAGDLLLVFFGSQNRAVTPPAGWTLISTGNNNYELNVFRKVAAGTEAGTSPVFTTDSGANSSHQVYRVTSWHGTTPPEGGTSATSSSTTPNPPSLTPSWGAEDTLWIAAFNGGFNGSPSVSTYPTNYTNGVDTVSGGGFQVSLLGTARRELNAASDDPGTFTISGAAEWVAQTVAVCPAVAIPPSPSTGGNRMGGSGAILKPPRSGR